MLIGLISDTHDKLEGIDQAFQIFISKQVSLILHAGDWTLPSTVQYIANLSRQANIPVKGVLGNNDKELEASLRSSTIYEGIEISTDKVFVTDINKKNVAVYHGDDERIVNNLIQEQIYDILVVGHTHKVQQERIDSTFIINPGSTAFAKPVSTTNVGSIAIFNVETSVAEIIYLQIGSPNPPPPPPSNPFGLQ